MAKNRRYNKFELAELSYRKELEEEKRRYEAAKKRRLALQTILTTLNDMPVNTLLALSLILHGNCMVEFDRKQDNQ